MGVGSSRSRGEYPMIFPTPFPHHGSSPLSRGIPPLATVDLGVPGIIPALAGNTGGCRQCECASRDHPRSRGEYMALCCAQFTESGSSPLSRGIQGGTGNPRGAGGIIPALAGNTHEPGHGRPAPTDHPRSRGEYITPAPTLTDCRGSSPLSRGIRRLPAGRVTLAGIIPALAGNTCWS